MQFDVKRKIDKFGRFVLPADLRIFYEITNNEKVVLLPVRNGIQVAKEDYFHMDQIPKNFTVIVDELGRIVIPMAFRNQFNFKPNDFLHIVPNEACMLIYKD